MGVIYGIILPTVGVVALLFALERTAGIKNPWVKWPLVIVEVAGLILCSQIALFFNPVNVS